MTRARPLLFASLLAGCAGAGDAPAPESEAALVFAAASLRDVMRDAGDAFRDAGGGEVDFNFAGSNVLAQQIEVAPGADLFLSANERWVDWLDDRGRLQPDTRRPLLSNQLQIVAHADSAFVLDDPADLAGLDFRYLSLADPDAVPAGIYAREWMALIPLESGGTLWDAVADRVAPAPDVRAALAIVEQQPDLVGIVYRTDASASRGAQVLYSVPVPDAPPITYTGALLRGAGAPGVGAAFMDFLASPDAEALFEARGFLAFSEQEATPDEVTADAPAGDG